MPSANHLDLDSHLNLINYLFTGATLEEEQLLPNDFLGLGGVQFISHHKSNANHKATLLFHQRIQGTYGKIGLAH